LESVPPDVNVAESWASNLVPVGLGVVSGWDTQVCGLSANGPSSLSDPDRLAGDSLGVADSLLEERLSAGDGVGLGVLEVWVSVDTDPVNGVEDIIWR